MNENSSASNCLQFDFVVPSDNHKMLLSLSLVVVTNTKFIFNLRIPNKFGYYTWNVLILWMAIETISEMVMSSNLGKRTKTLIFKWISTHFRQMMWNDKNWIYSVHFVLISVLCWYHFLAEFLLIFISYDDASLRKRISKQFQIEFYGIWLHILNRITPAHPNQS